MHIFLSTPLGTARITGDKSGVTAISILDEPLPDLPLVRNLPDPLQAAYDQLTAYFNGERQSFDFVINPIGTEFQRRVWEALREVPYGQTMSYLALARQLGDEKAIRAVAAANGRNPLWVVVPCHRIIGANGNLTGYAGGLWRKQWLLEHEGSRRNPTEGQLSLF